MIGMDRKGTVMILVLWTLAMLTMLSGYYAVEARIRRNIGHNVAASLQGKYSVQAILQMVSGHVALSDENAEESETALFIADGREYTMQFAGKDIIFHIENERGKLDINRASEEDIRNILSTFFDDSDLADTITDSIMDWRDQDKLVREHGAEDETYEAKRPAYHAANGDFVLQQELLLVNGVSSDIFYGPVIWKGEGEDGSETEWEGGLSDLTTIYNDTGKVTGAFAPPPLASMFDESEEAIAAASAEGVVFRLVALYDGIIYRVFWSQGNNGSFTVHEWQESPEQSV